MKRNREDEERERNRKEISQRSRQWEVVLSDNESSGNANDESSSSSSDEEIEADKKKKHKKEKGKKEKREKKDKKEKKEKKGKESKKKSKHHHHHHHDNDNASSSKGAVNQNEFGKYGIIREQDYFKKQREFEAYLEEVKHLPGVLGQGKREIMEHFKGFIEDYNTATLPHIKYYDLERWEMGEYQRKQLEQSRKIMNSSELIPDTFNDEEERRKEVKRQKLMKEQQELLLAKSRLSSDSSYRESMRKQDELRLQLQQAHKQGDRQTVERLERLLAPEQSTAKVKHPWA